MANEDDDDQANTPPPSRVGYGRPPVQHRFKPGVSGNPNGRRPKSKNIETLLEQELDSIVIVKEGNRKRRISKRQLIVIQLAQRAMKGDPKALDHLFKSARADPKPEHVEFTPVAESELTDFARRVLHRSNRDEHDDPGANYYEGSDPEADVPD